MVTNEIIQDIKRLAKADKDKELTELIMGLLRISDKITPKAEKVVGIRERGKFVDMEERKAQTD
jgi:hypothetical protein